MEELPELQIAKFWRWFLQSRWPLGSTPNILNIYKSMSIQKIPIILCYRHFCHSQGKKALKNVLQRCIHLPALEPLLHNAPPNILKHVVSQFSKILPHDPKARKLFVTSGGLKKIQEIKTESGSALHEYINTINNCYPEEIVRLVEWLQ